MFSRTTIASSIRMPIASESPSSDIVFSVKPNAYTAMKLESTDTGSARPVITVERHEFRKRNTTSTVSSAPSTSASSTFCTERSTWSPEFWTTSRRVPFGSVAEMAFTRASTCADTCDVLNPFDFFTITPTASRPL